jgi:5'-nucleotidase / UDP-sugar diphosphatase
MKLRLLPALLCAYVLAGVANAAELTILYTSEHHGTLQPIDDGPYKGLGGVARRAALIEKIRNEAKNVLLVDSGDLVIGTAMSTVFRGAPDIAAMSLMGYDALGLGNHDFDFGLDHLRELRKQAPFPFLCTNVRPRESGICERYVIKQAGTLRVGILGLIGRSFPDFFDANVVKRLDFTPAVDAAQSAAAALKDKVDVIVAVTHEENDEDLALAKAVPEIGVIVGGHTPGFDGMILNGAKPVQGRVAVAPRTPIFVKSHQQARTLGRVDLAIDRGSRAAEAQNIIIAASAPEEAKVAALVADYARRLEAETQRVVGHASVDLYGDSAIVRARETNLGNLVADLALKQASADIALVNSGSIRATIAAGPVTLKQVLRTLPYNDAFVSVTLTGAQLQDVMENSVSRVPDSGRFLQVAGMEVGFDVAAPVGSRVKGIRVGGKPLDRGRDYKVVINRFIADGGDGYTMLPAGRSRVDYQTPLRDLFLKALENGPVSAKEEDRIREVKAGGGVSGNPHADR